MESMKAMEVNRLRQAMKKTCQYVLLTLLLVGGAAPCLPAQATRQQTQSALFTQTIKHDEYHANVLNKIISVELHHASIEQGLRVIAKKAGLKLVFSKNIIPSQKSVSLQNRNITLENALWELLAGTDLRFGVSSHNHLVVMKSSRGGQETERHVQQLEAVSGTVTDASTGEALPGVNIKVKGTTTGTFTDDEGHYEIDVLSLQDTLVFSFVGYERQQVPINGRATINIALLQQALQGHEMVVLGYTKKERGEVTGAVANIGSEQVNQTSEMNLTNTLQGKLPGLVINDRGGEPGNNNTDILIRGKSTLGNNSPLIVIDGVVRDMESFNHLSPNDVESISVLKDASAAIYGARAANGVIVVQTKRGHKGNNEIQFNSSFGLNSFTRVPKMMNSWQFAQYKNEVAERFGRSAPYNSEDIKKFKSGDSPSIYPNTNWYNETFKQYAPQTHQNLSASGGSQEVQYYISGDYVDQKGNYSSNDLDYKQYQIRSNIDANFIKYLNIGFDLMGRYGKNHTPSTRGDTWVFDRAQRARPTEVAYYPNGLPAYATEKGMTPIKMNSDDSGWGKQIEKIFHTKLSFDLNMDWMAKGFNLSGYGSFDFRISNNENFKKPYTLWTYNSQTDEYNQTLGFDQDVGLNKPLTQTNQNWKNELYHLQLRYQHSFDNHNIDAFIAYEQANSLGEMISGHRNNLYSANKVELFAGEEAGRSVDGSSSVSGRVNYFGSVSYNYMRKYLIELTLRRDGSFNFPKGKRFGVFPGVSVGWDISKEPFMNGANNWLNNLKLRASWAKMGNDRIPSFQYLTKYAIGDYYIFGKTPTYYEGMFISNIPNPNITWEVSRNKDIGFDGSLWNGMISISFDYFYEKRRNILIKRNESVPDYTALELPDENLGKVNNSGIDLQLAYQNEGRDLSYHISGNFTYNHNRIVFMDEAKNIPQYRRKEGHPMNSFLVYQTDGVFNTQEEISNYPHLSDTKPGDLKYVDVNEDGEINGDDQVREYTSPTPEIQYGMNVGINYKNFGLDVFLQGQAEATTLLRFDDQGNRPEYIYANRWTEDNQEINNPRAFDINDSYNLASTYHLHNASFIRLKNVEISYRVDGLIPKTGINKFRIYLRGRNLWTLDHINHFDPEVNSSMGRYYPQLTTVTAGINIQF